MQQRPVDLLCFLERSGPCKGGSLNPDPRSLFVNGDTWPPHFRTMAAGLSISAKHVK